MSKLNPLDDNQPISPGKEIVDSQIPPSWWQYFAAGNRTTGGSVMMLIVGLAVGFPWGYYVKYKSFKSEGAEIVNQSINNRQLDGQSIIQMETRSNELNQSLKSLGFDQSEIDFFIKGDVRTLDKLKDKFNTYINDRYPYEPREDCDDDFFGLESSNEVNGLIRDRFNKVGDGNE